MSKSLDDLDPRIKPQAEELLKRAADLVVIDTLRTAAEQKVNIANGVSWTKRSKHLPQPPYGLALAIDVVPAHILAASRNVEKIISETDPSKPDSLVAQLLGFERILGRVLPSTLVNDKLLRLVRAEAANWIPDHPDWLRVAEIGEQLGLKWGGRWKKKDCPHFEYVETVQV